MATLPGVAGSMGGMLTSPTKGSQLAARPKTEVISPKKSKPMSPSRHGAGVQKGKTGFSKKVR